MPHPYLQEIKKLYAVAAAFKPNFILNKISVNSLALIIFLSEL